MKNATIMIYRNQRLDSVQVSSDFVGLNLGFSYSRSTRLRFGVGLGLNAMVSLGFQKGGKKSRKWDMVLGDK